MALLLSLLILVLIWDVINTYRDITFCPCDSSAYSLNNTNNYVSNKLCFYGKEEMLSKIDSAKFQLKDFSVNVFSSFNSSFKRDIDKHCDVVFHVVPSIDSNRKLCPGNCRPIPFVDVPVDWFTATTFNENTLLTCSLTLDMIATPIPTTIAKILRNIFFRRIMECYEGHLWNDHIQKSLRKNNHKRLYSNRNSSIIYKTRHYHLEIARRKVKSVVIWVGSVNTTYRMHMQSHALNHLPILSDDSVIAYAATEDLYQCHLYGKCRGKTPRFIPGSILRFNPPKGWACAQRRPLRSLAHVLLLYDSDFIVILDDDTYFNYDLFLHRYGSFVYQEMFKSSIVMGEFGGSNGDEGHISTQGIFLGGSGYVLGHALLSRLISYELIDSQYILSNISFKGYNYSSLGGLVRDPYRSNAQIHFLSFASEGIQLSKKYCGPAEEANQKEHKYKNMDDSLKASGDRCFLSYFPWIKRHDYMYIDDENFNYNFVDSQTLEKVSMSKVINLDRSRIAMKSYHEKHYFNDSSNPNPLKFANIIYRMLPIRVRLIDFCTNLMAGENSCYHSDHSIARCLIHAAYATPVGVICRSKVEVPKNLNTGFCFSTPNCEKYRDITCHRYVANYVYPNGTRPLVSEQIIISDKDSKGMDVEPFRMTGKRGHYKRHSSFYDDLVKHVVRSIHW